MSTPLSPTVRRAHPHDDAPDTAAAFRLLASLPTGTERSRVREEVTRAWLPMAHRIAAKYRSKGEPLDDLRQVAALALVKAVDRYDPDRGCAFESFAVPTITGEVRRHFRDHSWTLRVPRRVQELRNRVRTARQELGGEGGEPAVGALAERTGLAEDEVREGLLALHAHSTLSLDAPVNGSGDAPAGGSVLADTYGEPDPGLDTVVDREAVRPLLSRLPERERRMLYLRYFRDQTQDRIAAEFGLSQVHVSRILSTTCAKLRRDALREVS
ncbi:SigB/SigF/SigG family RNA polymerase sigma factor [Streptomyces sp. NPDC049906]|uniref:SigB/SigF/SigG family RNA polymerase sigma factor n=1 Tax=Streptomyces sp. NPDC049906 TaxID=3155656 RepID=UPI0034432074